MTQFTRRLRAKDGPFVEFLSRFDPAGQDSVFDELRAFVTKELRRGIATITDADRRRMAILSESLSTLQAIAAAEEARVKEAAKGSLKGRDHEISTESILGDLLAVTGDGLDECLPSRVSTATRAATRSSRQRAVVGSWSRTRRATGGA